MEADLATANKIPTFQQQAAVLLNCSETTASHLVAWWLHQTLSNLGSVIILTFRNYYDHQKIIHRASVSSTIQRLFKSALSEPER